MPNTSQKSNNGSKGFFRKKGWIPPFLVIGIASTYAFFFADAHLHRLIEHYASLVNGAQVNIASLKTRLLQGSIDIKDIEIAHHTQPTHNLLQIEKMEVQFLWAPLLAGKFVSPGVHIEGIRIFTNRDLYGSLPASVEPATLPPGMLDRVATGLYEPLRKELGDTPLRKLGLLSTGLGTQMRVDQLKDQLWTLKKITELGKEVEFQTGTWEKIAAIFDSNHLEIAYQNIADPKSSQGRSPASSKTEVSQLREQIRRELIKTKEAYEGIEHQLATLKGALSAVREPLDRDIVSVRESFGLPRLDGNDFTHALLGPKLLNFLERTAYWLDVSRRRMPATQHAHQGIVVIERPAESGADIVFGKRSTYPQFLLMQISAYSKADDRLNRGEVVGELTDFTSDPPIWRKPTRLSVEASFPGLGIRNVRLGATVDHTSSTPRETIRLNIDSFPLTNWVLENTPELKLTVNKADAKLGFDGFYQGDEILTQWNVLASQVEYGIDTRFRLMEDALKTAFVPFSSLYASGTVKGKPGNLKLELTSNVGQRLGNVLKDKFKHSLEAVDDIISQGIADEVDIPRRRLREQLEEAYARVTQRYEYNLKALQKLDAQLKTVQNKARTAKSS